VSGTADRAGVKTDTPRIPSAQTAAPDRTPPTGDTKASGTADRAGVKTDTPRIPSAQTAAPEKTVKTEKTEEKRPEDLSTVPEGIK
jgi:hypothetical protein